MKVAVVDRNMMRGAALINDDDRTNRNDAFTTKKDSDCKSTMIDESYCSSTDRNTSNTSTTVTFLSSLEIDEAHFPRKKEYCIQASTEAKRKARKMVHKSRFFNKNSSSSNKNNAACNDGGTTVALPTFDATEIGIGDILGSGAFGCVYALKTLKLKNTTSTPSSETDDENNNHDIITTTNNNNDSRRMALAKAIIEDDTTTTSKYAVKIVRPDLIYNSKNNPSLFVRGARDLVGEYMFLSHLRHEHIIQLRGYSNLGPGGFEYGCTGLFLLMDRLQDTLVNRLLTWHTLHERKRFQRIFSKLRKNITKPTTSTAHQLDEETLFFIERLNVVKCIASALSYLHSHGICFRDAKPENVGFEIHTDKVKLFDFGLAKELAPSTTIETTTSPPLSSSSNHSTNTNGSNTQNSNNNIEFLCEDGEFAGTVSRISD